MPNPQLCYPTTVPAVAVLTVTTERDGQTVSTVEATADDLHAVGYWRPTEVYAALRRAIANLMDLPADEIADTDTIGELVRALAEDVCCDVTMGDENQTTVPYLLENIGGETVERLRHALTQPAPGVPA